MYYAAIGLLAALILPIINHDVFRRTGSAQDVPARREYRRFLYAVFAYFITDALWGVLDAFGRVWLLYADTVVYFCAMALALMLWSRYVLAYLGKTGGFTSFLSFAGKLYLIWQFMVLVFNCFIPTLFWFDAGGGYHAEWARYITFGLQFILFLITAVYMLLVSRGAEGSLKIRYRTIGFFGLAMSVFITLQIFFPLLPLYSIAFLLGTCLLHTFVVEGEKEEYRSELESLIRTNRKQEADLGTARQMVYTDPLTKVKSKHAYVEAEYDLDRQIEAGELRDFAVAVFDLNNLKGINDTLGHEEGDRCICAASSLICKRFKHSPVYRIGGDEFVAFLRGQDFQNRDALAEAFDREVTENIRKGEIAVAAGIVDFDPKKHNSYRSLFEQADKQMYADKTRLKEITARTVPVLRGDRPQKYRYADEMHRLMEESSIPFAVYQFLDHRVVTLVLSRGFCSLFGYTDREQAYYDMDNDMYKDTHPDDAARIADAAFRFATEGGRYETVYRSRDGKGGWNIIHARGEHVFTDTGVRLAQVWYTDEGTYLEDGAEDRGELNRALTQALHRESILNAAYYDHLTGLPTMPYFFDLAEAGAIRLREEGQTPVMLFMDLNGMKHYNRTYGFAEGDQLLQRFGKLLAKQFSNENCCRTGEDHFAVFAAEAGIEDALDRLFREWQEIGHLPIRAGIFVSGEERVNVGAACDRAKFACDTLKNTPVSAFCRFDEEMQSAASRQLYIVNHLDEALEQGWIQVHYQPVVRAASGRICSEEALTRWVNPEAGTLSPGVFIPPLEEAGLVYRLDLYVVEQVLKKLERFRAEGITPVPQSVNLSRTDFAACDMVEEIRRRVDEAGADRSMVIIEITESALGSDFDLITEQVERFHALGFPVWMDDFGSGYSSLDLLQSIRFDLLKFDMHFMHDFKRGGKGQIILTELMKMVSALGIDSVCEGVETEEQASLLKEIGCSKLQGYYYSRPKPLDEILAMVKGEQRVPLEDPGETAYYENVGKVNLFDLGTLAYEGGQPMRNVFNTLPMAILEARGDRFTFVRANQSYREFTEGTLGIRLDDEERDFSAAPEGSVGSDFRKTVRACCAGRGLAVFDGKLSDGSVVRYFLRYVDTNPLTGADAVIVAVLSIAEAE